VNEERDRTIWLLLTLARQSGWVALIVVVVLVVAACWLAYNTDATRIKVPGVITWEGTQRRDEGSDPEEDGS
jgi:hypothetical protein